MSMSIRASSFRLRTRGFTLVELMIAMLLGLIALGAVISLIALNSRNYRTGEAIGQIQDGMRTAFDLISRDVREARGTGCGSLNQAVFATGFVPQWWTDSNTPLGIRLYGEGAAMGGATPPSNRAAQGAAIQIQGVTGPSYTVTDVTHPKNFTVPGNNFKANNLVVVCNGRFAEVVQVESAGTNTVTLKNGTVNDFTPVYSDPAHREVLYPTMTLYTATTWYIGNNDINNNAPKRRTATSLYRIRIDPFGAPVREEIIEGVTNLVIQYRTGNGNITNLAPGAEVTNSATSPINAVEVALSLQSADTKVGDMAAAGEQRLTRDYSSIIAVRNP